MKVFSKPLFAFFSLVAPLFAGALLLEVGNPASNPEALKNHAILAARITACHSPGETTLTATAEGLVNGMRKSIPLKVISLSTAGTFAVTREWPNEGIWVIQLVATNPEYRDYATSVLVPIHYFLDAPEALTKSLAEFDLAGNHQAMRAVLSAARPRDALTLWHRLERTQGQERGGVRPLCPTGNPALQRHA